jgi:hypothetical protein
MSETHSEPTADGTIPTRTGVPAVEEALARLEGLEERPVDEHPAVFEAVHTSLRAVLSGDPVT